MTLTKAIPALCLAGALVVGQASLAAAAITGALTPSQGEPGDRITLTIGDAAGHAPVGQTGTVYIISTQDLDRQTAKYGHQVCGTSGDHAVGAFSWKGGIGSLSFTIPDVPANRYYFQVQVRNTSPDCWRIGTNEGGPILLTVSPADATNSATPAVPDYPAPFNPLLILGLIAAVVVPTTVIARITRKPM